MPNYVTKAQKNQSANCLPRHNMLIIPAYDNKQQYAPLELPAEPLLEKEKNHIQAVVGTFLYYGRAMDSTILVAINDIASSQF